MDAPSETLLGGRVVFRQPVEGYRAPVDGLLLAHFAGRSQRLAVDLGAGAGMITLALLARGTAAAVLSVERDPLVASFLRSNVDDNGFAPRCEVFPGDVGDAARARRGCADLVLANPPYWSEGATRPALHPAVRAARGGEGPAALPAFVRAARSLLGRSGRTCFVWPAAEVGVLLAQTTACGLHAKRLRFVHPLADRAAVRVLGEFKPGRPGGCVMEPPLVLQREPGVPSDELSALTH